eukprot:m.121363 g.121363  ORF g.121363 m.121363 type:complete len:61 (-) comp13704_c0_seq11:917-1099(-)
MSNGLTQSNQDNGAPELEQHVANVSNASSSNKQTTQTKKLTSERIKQMNALKALDTKLSK